MKIAYLFSGQGAQKPGMMKELYDSIPEVREIYHIANKALQRDITSLCFEGKSEELNLTHNTQPCVLAADLAAYMAVKTRGIKPDVVAGFSLGEYAALAVSGVLGIEETFRIIQIRADAMQEAVPIGQGGMVAVIGISEEKVIALCKQVNEGYVELANLNCPGQIVVSGDAEGLKNFINVAEESKVVTMSLPVSAPFHCKLMKSAADRLREIFLSLSLGICQYPIYMNVDADMTTDSSEAIKKILLQTISPVYWEKTLLNMHRDGVNIFIELGPGKTLSTFVKKTIKNVIISRVSDCKTLDQTVDMVVE